MSLISKSCFKKKLQINGAYAKAIFCFVLVFKINISKAHDKLVCPYKCTRQKEIFHLGTMEVLDLHTK